MSSCSESSCDNHGRVTSCLFRAFLLICALFVSLGWSSLARGQAFTLSTENQFVSFADTEVGSYGSAIIQINTDGSHAINAVSTSGDFNVTDTADCATPVVAGNCTITVRFRPSAPGRRWAPLVVTDEVGTKTGFGLVGKGIGPALAFVPGVISTIAGTGTSDFGGDGGAATSAFLNAPWGIVFDQNGNFYVADANNNRVRKVDTGGTISTFAGTGTAGFSGDHGAASEAKLSHPAGLAFDSAGNLYIADVVNGSVRKVDLNGIITTVAGAGTQGFGGGDGEQATTVHLGDVYGIAVDDAGNLFIADNSNNAIRKVDPNGRISTIAGDGTAAFGGDGGLATEAQLNQPSCVMVDYAGAVYLCDSANFRVRKIAAGGIITTVAGTGLLGYTGDEGAASSAKLGVPYGLALDAGGDLYIADLNNSVVRVVEGSGIIHTLVGTTTGFSGDGGSALAAQLQLPAGLAVDSFGNLLIADAGNNVVRKVVVTGPPALEFGTLNIGDYRTKAVAAINPGTANLNFSEVFSDSGSFTLSGNCSTETPLVPGGVCSVQVRFSPIFTGEIDGTLEFVDNVGSGVQDVNLHGTGQEVVVPPSPATQLVFVPAIPGSVTNGGNLGTVTVKAEDGDGNVDTDFGDAIEFVVTDPNSQIFFTNSRTASEGVATFDLSSTACTVAGEYSVTATSGELSAAIASFTVAPDGPPIVPGAGMIGNSRLFSPTNIGESSSRTFSLRITGPITIASVTAGGDFTFGQVVVNGQRNGAVVEGCSLDTALNDGDSCTLRVIFTPTAPGQRWHPLVVTDNDGKKYSFGLAGVGTGVAVGFRPGSASAIAGNSELSTLSTPASIALDADGNLYIADYDGGVVRKVDPSGVLTTIAGGGDTDADDIPATDAILQGPTAVAVDAAGNLYISDWDASAIRKVDVNGTISTLESAEVDGPTALRLDSTGNLYVADDNLHQVFELDKSGAFSVVVGTTQGYAGDGDAATAAQLNSPEGLALDDSGNLYIADTDNHVVRKVDTEGTITRIAGASDGTAGYDGDGGPATSAHLHSPMGLDLDAAGNLYITDTDNRVIRKVNPQGIIMTVAGFIGGDIQDRAPSRTAAGNTQGSRWSRARFSQRIPAQQNSRGPGVQAILEPVTSVNLYSPVHAVVDASGNLFISDYENALVYKADLATATAMDFGSVGLGDTSEPQTAWMENFGNADLAISQISVSDHFQSGTGNRVCTTESPVAPGALCTLPLAFAPTEAGTINGSAVLTDNAVNSPQTLTLTGAGVANAAAEIEFDSTFGSVALGGNLGAVGVTLRDGHGYVASDAAATLAVTIAGPQGFTAYQGQADAAAGIASIDLSAVPLSVAGEYTITVSSEGLTSAQAGFTVTAAPVVATRIVFSTSLPTSVENGGNLGTVRAQLEDGSGNVAATSTASVSVDITGPAGFTRYSHSVAAASGVATLDLSAVPLSVAGSYTISASSAGLTAASRTFTVEAAPDFDLSMESETVTVASGNAAIVNLTVSPVGGLTDDIQLSCSGLPAYARCSFSAPSVHADGSNSALHSVLTIHTDGSVAALKLRRGSILLAGWMGAFGLLLFPAWRCGSKKRWLAGASPVLLAALLLTLAGCGSGSGNTPLPTGNSTPAGTYSVTINAAATGSSHSAIVTLRVN